MHPLRKQRLIIIISIVLGVGLATGLVLLALKENLNAFYTPKDITAGKVSLEKTIRIGGLVELGSVRRKSGELKVVFTLSDTEASIPVEFNGILPDLFREGQGIIAIGKLVETDSAGLVVVAEEVLAKHDENYMSPELKAAMEKNEEVEVAHPKP